MLGFKVRILNTGTECRSLIVSRLTDKVDKIKYQNRVPILENNLYGVLDGLNVSIGLSTKEEVRNESSLRVRPASLALKSLPIDPLFSNWVIFIKKSTNRNFLLKFKELQGHNCLL